MLAVASPTGVFLVSDSLTPLEVFMRFDDSLSSKYVPCQDLNCRQTSVSICIFYIANFRKSSMQILMHPVFNSEIGML